MIGSTRVNVLGQFSVQPAGGGVARFRTNRAGEVVALLVLQDSRQMLREELAFQIWPDVDRSARLANLRPALSYARQALGDPNCLSQEGEMITLNPNVDSDWREIEALEARAQGASGSAQQLNSIYALYNALREPLLPGWRSEWIDRYRDYHTRRQNAALRQLAEMYASMGDWPLALEHSRRLCEADPFDEEAVQIQLRALGALGRLAEAQAEYTRFSKFIHSELGLKTSTGLRQLADTVVSGRLQSRGNQATSAQKELVWQILDTLADEDPERVLHLLASPVLNWSIATTGPDLRSILERVYRDTTGWSSDRCGVAKRLLQIYSQEIEAENIVVLASDLLANANDAERAAALNFLSFADQYKGHPGLAEEHLLEALKLAKSLGLDYYAAMSQANLAFVYMRQMQLDLAVINIESAIDDLATATEPNALLSSAFAISGRSLMAWLDGDFDKAKNTAEEWYQFCLKHGVTSFDSTGKGIYALACASTEPRQARSAMLSAVHSAMADRNVAAQLGVIMLLMAAVRISFSSQDLNLLTKRAKNLFNARGYAILPSVRALLGESTSSDNVVPTPFEVLAQIRTVILRSP